jgi:hypothetical protein
LCCWEGWRGPMECNQGSRWWIIQQLSCLRYCRLLHQSQSAWWKHEFVENTDYKIGRIAFSLPLGTEFKVTADTETGKYYSWWQWQWYFHNIAYTHKTNNSS